MRGLTCGECMKVCSTKECMNVLICSFQIACIHPWAIHPLLASNTNSRLILISFVIMNGSTMTKHFVRTLS